MKQIIIAGLMGISLIVALLFFIVAKTPIKIGILHSLTGSLALSEKPIVDAELMAIDELNAKGGLLGRPIVPVIADGKSDELIFVQEAERLIVQEKVVAIVGGWTSGSCRIMQPMIEKYNNLLFYPVTHEGIQESPNILFVGATQNQQIVPAALWSYYNLGKRFFIVGSDEIFSRVASKIIQETLASVDAQVVGDEYIMLGSKEVEPMIKKIIAAKPDVIINTIQGDSNVPFFEVLRAHGITPEKIPVMSIGSVTETEFVGIGSSAMAGDYTTASYFQSVSREENSIFVTNFKKRYGSNRVLSEACEAGYVAVHIWANAIRIARAINPDEVKKHLNNRMVNAPEGVIYTDNRLMNCWKMIYVGRLRSDGQFTIVWDSKKTVQPLVFPIFNTKQYWQTFVQDLYTKWGNRWSRKVD
jgi:urea transport system substrate-binding protein